MKWQNREEEEEEEEDWLRVVRRGRRTRFLVEEEDRSFTNVRDSEFMAD